MKRTSFTVLIGSALLVATTMAGAASAEADQQSQLETSPSYNDGSAASSATVAPGQVAPGTNPGTTNANGAISGALHTNQRVNAANQAQYDADLAAYDAAMQAHGKEIAHQDVHYARQQEAYAQAMHAWREQDYACRHGSSQACKSPAPDPANYY